jgi:pyruvate dehydrogenase E1 component alpha subunit/2-oxoisovalerate dehydrogenase E1 component alpha subunit
MISHLGAMISVVNGCLLAKRFQGESGFVGATCIGDGATSTGAFHEAVNAAAIEKLPLVLIIANNQYAYSTPNEKEFACRDLVDRAPGYGVEGHSLDGTDLETCMRTLEAAVGRAREGRGPQMVVASLLRLCGHGEHDDAGYIDPELKAAPIGRDCLDVAGSFLVERGWADDAKFGDWRAEAAREVEETVATVQREGGPDPYAEEWSSLSTKSLLDSYPEQ